MPYPITPTRLSQQASEQSLKRGEQYFLNHAVENCFIIDTTIHGYVWGTQLYHTQINNTGVGTCSCPYSYEGWCKHLIATGLNYIKLHTAIPSISLHDILHGLSQQQIEKIIETLIQNNPILLHTILPINHPFLDTIPLVDEHENEDRYD